MKKKSKDKDKDDDDELISNDKFLVKNILFLEDEVEIKEGNKLKKQLLYLIKEKPKTPLTIYINSYGGDEYIELMITDLMNSYPGKITTIATGYCMSAATSIFLMGDERIAFPNTTFMLHKSWWDKEGSVDEHENELKEAKRLMNIYYDLIKSRTTIKNPEEYLKKDRYISAVQAKKFNIVTKLLKNKVRKYK